MLRSFASLRVKSSNVDARVLWQEDTGTIDKSSTVFGTHFLQVSEKLKSQGDKACAARHRITLKSDTVFERNEEYIKLRKRCDSAACKATHSI